MLRRGAGPGKGLRRHGRKPNFCSKYHADEPAFWKRVYYWIPRSPTAATATTDCMDYNDWVQAWTEIKG